jgi:hypothetical protein
MYQLFMKNLIITILLLSSLSLFSQSSGTFKVAKKEQESKSDRKYRSERFFSGAGATWAGKSSEKKSREQTFLLGYTWDFSGGANKIIVNMGILAGRTDIYSKYKGITLGAFARYFLNVNIGPTSVRIPIELSYKRLKNKLDFRDINQYKISTGLSVHLPQVSGCYITLLGGYHIDSNSSDTFKGFHPTLRIDYYF